ARWPLPGKSAISWMAFSPDGESLAATAVSDAGAAHGLFLLWDVASRKEKVRRKGFCFTGAFSPDGKLLAVPGAVLAGNKLSEGEVRLWDTAAGQEKTRLAWKDAVTLSVAFSPDGNTLAGAMMLFAEKKEKPVGGEVRLWDAASGQEKARWTANK